MPNFKISPYLLEHVEGKWKMKDKAMSVCYKEVVYSSNMNSRPLWSLDNTFIRVLP